MEYTNHIFVPNKKAEVPYMSLFLVTLGSSALLDQDSQLSNLGLACVDQRILPD